MFRRADHAATNAPPEHEGTPEHPSDSYRDRMWAGAAQRGIPLATILTVVLVAFIVFDLNALAILLLWVLRRILLYAVVAFFLALLLSPAVRGVERVLRISRGASVSLVFVVALLAFGGIVLAFTEPLVQAITHFAKELPTLVRQAEHGKGRIGHLLTHFHLEAWVKKNAPKIAANIAKSLKPAQALSVGASALSSLIALSTIAVLTLFLMLEAAKLRRGVLSMMSPPMAARISRVYHEASRSVSGYMLGNMLTSIIAGIVVFVTLVIMGVPYPLLLGLWVALVDLLPLVGGLLAGVPVVIIAAFHSVPALIVTAIVFLIYQQVENHVLNPVIMSRTVRLNPLWVLVAVLVGATLGDRIGSGLGAFVGALIGIPAAGAVQVVAREIRRGPTRAGVDGRGEPMPETVIDGPPESPDPGMST